MVQRGRGPHLGRDPVPEPRLPAPTRPRPTVTAPRPTATRPRRTIRPRLTAIGSRPTAIGSPPTGTGPWPTAAGTLPRRVGTGAGPSRVRAGREAELLDGEGVAVGVGGPPEQAALGTAQGGVQRPAASDEPPAGVG
jgi:hypothetical protein